MASLLDLLGLGPNVSPWFPPAGNDVPLSTPPAPIAEAQPVQEGPFDRLRHEANGRSIADEFLRAMQPK